MEQPVTVTGLGVAQPMPYFGPQMSVTGMMPRPLGIYDPVSTERPCGGYGGYDAAANEARRLMEAGWNSPTNLNDPFERVNTSALNYPFERPRYREPSSSLGVSAVDTFSYISNLMKEQARIQIESERELQRQQQERESFRKIQKELDRQREETFKALVSSSQRETGPAWSPKIDYENGLWERKHTTRDETLIGYTPYGTHTHIGSDFVSIRDEKSGKGMRWQL